MSWDKRGALIVHGDDPFNAEPPRAALAEQSITPLDAFYVRNHGPVPELDPSAWRLRVDGLVDRQLELSLAELRSRFPRHEVAATLQCAGNRRADFLIVRDIPGEAPWGPGATGTAVWSGVRLTDVLAAAGIHEDAEHVAFLGADVSEEPEPPQAFGALLPRHKATADEVLLAWEMNGEPLPRVHGAPVRLVVPGYIGARSVKWLERITAQAGPSNNFFQAESYRLLAAEADPDAIAPGDGVALGAVAVNADILSPDEGAAVAPGPLGLGLCVRRRRSPHRSCRPLDRRGAELAPGRSARPAGSLDLASLGGRGGRRRPDDRDRRPGLGQRGGSPARERCPPLEPEGLRQQRVGAGQRQRGPSGG